MKMIRVGIVGCGLIGNKRADSLGSNCLLCAVADLNIDRAKKMASKFSNVKIFPNSEELINDAEIDLVIISTLHDSLSKLTLLAIKNNKHVLVEKPGARNSKELLQLLEASKKSNSKIHVGFNHRFHRAFLKAKGIVEEGLIGEIMFIRGRYGHGGRLGYESEWRANFELSGGGELIDQGPHMLDLSRWFFGQNLKYHSSKVNTYFWNMEVDDNAFLIVETEKDQTAFLHVSCTEWKNKFSFEIYGKLGKLEISGLGGSYGTETLKHYHMLPEMGPPETYIYEFPMEDNSWEVEINEFISNILKDKKSDSNLENAVNILEIIDKAYGKN